MCFFLIAERMSSELASGEMYLALVFDQRDLAFFYILVVIHLYVQHFQKNRLMQTYIGFVQLVFDQLACDAVKTGCAADIRSPRPLNFLPKSIASNIVQAVDPSVVEPHT